MNYKIILVLLLLPFLIIGQDAVSTNENYINSSNGNNDSLIQTDSATLLAQQQLDAYNKRDIDAFLIPYDDEVEVYIYPNKLQYIGKETMRAKYSKMFENTPNLHCELVARIAKGNVVIDQERVRFGDRVVKAVAIYHTENNKIKKVFFIK